MKYFSLQSFFSLLRFFCFLFCLIFEIYFSLVSFSLSYVNLYLQPFSLRTNTLFFKFVTVQPFFITLIYWYVLSLYAYNFPQTIFLSYSRASSFFFPSCPCFLPVIFSLFFAFGFVSCSIIHIYIYIFNIYVYIYIFFFFYIFVF